MAARATACALRADVFHFALGFRYPLRRGNTHTLAGVLGYGRRALSTSRASGMSQETPPVDELGGASGKIKVNGVDLYYERSGTGGHALLCMPGALGSVQTDFSPQMKHFGRAGNGFTAVGFDPRGYGKSRPPRREFPVDPLFYEVDAHDAVGVMQGLGFDKFSLLGWSDGGVSAILAAAKYPQNVENLVIWGANAYVSKTDIELVENTRDVAQWSPRMREPMEAVYGGEFPGLWSDWMDGFFGIYNDKDRKGDLCTNETSLVRCRSLVLHGVKDAMCPIFHAEFLAKHLPNCRYVTYPDGKHNIHLRYQNEFNKLVEDFLNRVQ